MICSLWIVMQKELIVLQFITPKFTRSDRWSYYPEIYPKWQMITKILSLQSVF